MATLFSNTRWTSSEPKILLRATCEYQSRTSSTVQLRPILYISAVSGSSFFGYNIRATCTMSNYNSGEVTIKNNSPNKWTSELSYNFGWHTVNASASTTSITVSFTMASNSGRGGTYSGNITIPVGNTAPYWPSGATFSLNYTGTVAENVSTITATTSGATDSQGDTITYRFRWYRSSELVRTYETTSKSDSYSFSNLSEGQTLYAIVDCKDSLTGYGSSLTSNTITKNKFTNAGLNINNYIWYDTGSIGFTRTDASNTTGNTSFTYVLSSSNITVYNGSWSSSNKSLSVAIYKSGDVPTGPYILFDDLKNYLAPTYSGRVTFVLTTSNAYGSSKSSSMWVTANIRKNPTSFTLNEPTGAKEIYDTSYFIINRFPLYLSWTESSDLLGTTITYKVEYSINGGTWTTLGTTTSTSMTFPTRDITSTQQFKFRVTATTEYDTTYTVTYDSELTLHYYNPPILDNIVVNRHELSFDISWRVIQNSSINNVLGIGTFELSDYHPSELIDKITIDTQQGKSQYNTPIYNYAWGESESYSFTLEISWTDSICKALNLNTQTQYEIIPRYNPIFSVREKGVGVRAIAGDGTTCMIRSNPHVQLDGEMIIGGTGVHPVIFYDELYVDANGVLRAAKDFIAGHPLRCIVINSYGIQVGTNVSKTDVVKDQEVTLYNNSWSYTTKVSF